jgi:hypothetical protein
MEETNAVVAQDHVPKFEISLEQNKARLEQMRQFVAEQMIKGIDYAPIPGCGDKPTLLKPGAEKLNAIMGFYPEFMKLNEIFDQENKLLVIEYKCVLKSKKTGIKQAEGIGVCNSKEKKYINQDFFSIWNTINKMAQKRAYVGATLMATALSQNFTQDVEDYVEGKEEPQTVYGRKDTTKDSFGATYTCMTCAKEITEKVAKYSADKFGKMLCFEHQKDEKPLN